MHSIKQKILFILMGMLIPLVVFILCYNVYMMRFIEAQVAQSRESTLSLYNRQLQVILEQIEKEMSETLVSSVEFKTLAYMDRPDDTRAYMLTYELGQKYKNRINREPSLSACMIYNKKNQLLYSVYGEGISGVEIKEDFEKYLKGLLFDAKIFNQWQIYSENGQAFLYRIAGYQETYEICVVNLSELPFLLEDSSTFEENIIFFDEFLSGKVEILTESAFVEKQKIHIYNKDDYYFSGVHDQYLVVVQPVAHTGVYIAYVTEYDGTVKEMNCTQILLLILSILIIMTIPAAYILLKKIFFRPVDQLMATMQIMKNGNLDEPARTVYKDQEFIRVNEMFLEMISQIKILKIEQYENELEKKNMMLEYYQKQIRPHFFQNCLKNIFGLAQKQNYKAIQDNIIYLSKYLNHIMRNNNKAIFIEEELDYIENYIKLQALSVRYAPVCEIINEIEPQIFKIPPVSLLSFIENSVKYYGKPQEGVKIKINVRYLGETEEKFIYISIYDNGNGFPKDILLKFNHLVQRDKFESHLGIFNVIQRFNYFYGKDNVNFLFDNDYGAHIDIFIKVRGEDVEGSKNDANADSYC